MPANYVLIGEQTTNATVSSVTFSNIPQTGYSDLKIVISARSNAVRDDDYAIIALNGVTTDQSARVIYGTGSANGSVAGTPVSTPICAANNTANTFGNSEVYIPNYTSNTDKAFTQVGVLENNATWGVQNIGAGLWNPSTSVPITNIVFSSTYGSFVAGSTFSMYGIAAFGTTPTAVPKASGGDIVANDGTYWYHAFLSSGTFIPQSTLSCDVVVVAGGGGGGGSGPGGGAGGLLTFTSQSLTATAQTVTIGAGGAAGYTATQVGYRGTTGNDSQFGALTLVKGGGGGGANDNSGSQNGLTGGSGGGAGSFASTNGTGGSPTSGQGNAGGNSSTDGATYRNVGGGGGAGAAGGNATSLANGAGGIGATSATITAMGNATSTGQLVSSSRYYAGGGGYSVAGSGGGGTLGVAGTVNTGGGGGPAPFTSSSTPSVGGAGGSGIVIVRYTMA